MSDPFVAEIRIFRFNFAPKGWAFCDGQMLPISQNTALFSLLGTTYGGDGKIELRAAGSPGQRPDASWPGTWTVSSTTSARPAARERDAARRPRCRHTVTPASGHSDIRRYDQRPQPNALRARGAVGSRCIAAKGVELSSANNGLTPAGGSQPHNNMQPYLTLNFCIALQGVFPPRS